MYSFMNDYSEACHPRLLEAIGRTNMEQHDGYGMDEDCTQAKKILRDMLQRPDVDIHFLVGGTQTNVVGLATIMRPWEAVISSDLGHIALMEAGAIEATGHKVITCHCPDGKLKPADVREAVARRNSDYTETPRVVYISNCTELGTIYSKTELRALSECCHELGLYLYLDGARIGAALTCMTNDLIFSDIAELTDMFYIGATKCGAMFGEALVTCNPALKPHIRGMVRQRGGLFAKGWLLGIQFKELFRDGLFFELAYHANRMAYILRAGLEECGYDIITKDHTNQFFLKMPNEVVEKLKKQFTVYEWVKDNEGQTLVRITCSWATQEEECHRFVRTIKAIVSGDADKSSIAASEEEAALQLAVKRAASTPVKEQRELSTSI